MVRLGQLESDVIDPLPEITTWLEMGDVFVRNPDGITCLGIPPYS